MHDVYAYVRLCIVTTFIFTYMGSCLYRDNPRLSGIKKVFVVSSRISTIYDACWIMDVWMCVLCCVSWCVKIIPSFPLSSLSGQYTFDAQGVIAMKIVIHGYFKPTRAIIICLMVVGILSASVIV